jgi:hypothetical protein
MQTETPQTEEWLEVRLFYAEPFEEFLTKIVKPYCNTVLETGAAKYFFFIRYWERGSHIRLRFFGEKNTLYNIVKPNLEGYFSNVFDMNPSRRDDPNYPPNVEADDIWFPNNSIQFVDYEPEIERYAGKYGLTIVEKQFFASSKAVLESMAEIGTKQWSYEEKLGIAIKLHLSFVHALGFDIATSRDFFKEVFHHWLPLSIQRERYTKAQFDQLSQTMIQTFEQFFNEQKEGLVSYHAALWEIFSQEETFEDDYLNEWYAASRFTKQELNLAAVQSLLEQRPAKYQINFEQKMSDEQCLYWEIYSDFFHMTNNRLGLANRDESYLAYLMMRSMECL